MNYRELDLGRMQCLIEGEPKDKVYWELSIDRVLCWAEEQAESQIACLTLKVSFGWGYAVTHEEMALIDVRSAGEAMLAVGTAGATRGYFAGREGVFCCELLRVSPDSVVARILLGEPYRSSILLPFRHMEGGLSVALSFAPTAICKAGEEIMQMFQNLRNSVERDVG